LSHLFENGLSIVIDCNVGRVLALQHVLLGVAVRLRPQLVQVHTIRVGTGLVPQKVTAIFGCSQRRSQLPTVHGCLVDAAHTRASVLFLRVRDVGTHRGVWAAIVMIVLVDHHFQDLAVLAKHVVLTQSSLVVHHPMGKANHINKIFLHNSNIR